jgi:hypothetical protein
MATKRGSLPGLKREKEVAKLIFECVGPGCRIISVYFPKRLRLKKILKIAFPVKFVVT